MSDSFEADMLDFCVRFLTKHGAQLSAEQLSMLSALFPNQQPILSNPLDPTSFTFHWTVADEPPLSEYIGPLEVALEAPVTALEAPVTVLEAPPPPKRRCPYGYNGAWASPIPVRVARKMIEQSYWRKGGLQDVMAKYAKHGEKRLTHEIAINYLADRKGVTPEEFLRRIPLPPRGKKTYYGWTGHGDYCIAEW